MSPSAMPSTTPISPPLRICVGDQTFVTTASTLASAGRGSLLARSASSIPTSAAAAADEHHHHDSSIFFDRDPASFRILLNLLRTRTLPPSFHHSLDALIDDASFYGLLRILKEAMAPAPLDGIDLERYTHLLPTGRDPASALCASPDGSVFISHGSKITAFDWALRRSKTTLTEFNAIQSLHSMSDSHVACGSADLPGLHVYDAVRGVHATSLVWPHPSQSSSACVRSISSNSTTLFAAFDDGRGQDNTIVLIDRVTLQIAGEIAQQQGDSPHTKVATKLQWLPTYNWLLTLGIHHDGSLGNRAYVRIWDVRQPNCVWEWKEPDVFSEDPSLDCLGDIAVDEGLAGMFKVSTATGNISMADMRHLRAEDPWMTLRETNPRMAVMEKSSASTKLLCQNRQVFCSRGSDLEVWSLVDGGAEEEEETEYWETSFRRNFVERRRYGAQDITLLESAGQRLFVARRGMQGVEVWETKRKQPMPPPSSTSG